MQDLRGDSGVLDRIRHLILPASALALVQIAGWTRYIRSSMLETLRQDYVRTARSKGLGERAVLYVHAFRNALMPLVTLVGLALPEVFGGAYLIEQIFAWNGLGRLSYQAAVSNDYTLIMGATLFFAVLTLLGNLIADVLYAVADPRVRYRT
jgi:peptide/nickel transport system permease protein